MKLEGKIKSKVRKYWIKMRSQHRITIFPGGQLLQLKQDLAHASRTKIQMRGWNKLSRKKRITCDSGNPQVSVSIQCFVRLLLICHTKHAYMPMPGDVFVLFFCHLAFTTQRSTPPTCHHDLSGRAWRQWKRSALGDKDNKRLLWNPLISSDRKIQP